MRVTYVLLLTIILTCCKEEDKTLTAWEKTKADTAPEVILTSEFGTPYRQPLATGGWEDGVGISRDGLSLYCIYAPGDLLSWVLNSSDNSKFTLYKRGPAFGMDLVTNPAGLSSWVQSDILYASRKTLTEKFTKWNLSNMARAVFSEGSPCPFENSGFVFTSNDKAPTYDVDIWRMTGYPNPSSIGEPMPGFPHTIYTEDNPHMERLIAQSLVLFFDTDNYPGNIGGHDLWYSVSNDNATTWSTPVNVSTLNTSDKEHQPCLYKDLTGDWYLYFSANHNGKLSIFRSKQLIENNWNKWSDKELVISAGSTTGIGEPSLTTEGDLSFVVVYENASGSEYDRYDADPWYLPKKH